jgi:hypothetical protein
MSIRSVLKWLLTSHPQIVNGAPGRLLDDEVTKGHPPVPNRIQQESVTDWRGMPGSREGANGNNENSRPYILKTNISKLTEDLGV